jgi:hypothetical protein
MIPGAFELLLVCMESWPVQIDTLNMIFLDVLQ